MGISFWHKKKEEPQAPKAVPENGVNAVKRSDTESDAPGGVRLRRIAVGAAGYVFLLASKKNPSHLKSRSHLIPLPRK